MTNNLLLERRERNSSVELFRILATFLVIIVHLNGWMAGNRIIAWDDVSVSLDHRILQHVIQALSVVCVNCFLIISGWYGVRLKFASIWKLWCILVCIYVPFEIVTEIYKHSFSPFEILGSIIAFSRESYYIQCYLLLIVLSPIINTFCNKYQKKVLPLALTLWGIEFCMESIFKNKCFYIEGGYAPYHFILMYLLARSAHFHKESIITINSKHWLMGYFICALLVCLLSMTSYEHTWSYSNPIVVVESFCLFFPFLSLKFSNKWVNWIAGSTLSVYIIQVTSPVCPLLIKLDEWALLNLNYHTYLSAMFIFGGGYSFVFV